MRPNLETNTPDTNRLEVVTMHFTDEAVQKIKKLTGIEVTPILTESRKPKTELKPNKNYNQSSAKSEYSRPKRGQNREEFVRSTRNRVIRQLTQERIGDILDHRGQALKFFNAATFALLLYVVARSTIIEREGVLPEMFLVYAHIITAVLTAIYKTEYRPELKHYSSVIGIGSIALIDLLNLLRLQLLRRKEILEVVFTDHNES